MLYWFIFGGIIYLLSVTFIWSLAKAADKPVPKPGDYNEHLL